jgi:hypothetical protein
MRGREPQDLPAGRLVLIEVAGLILACVCAFLGYLFAPRDAFFGEQNSGVTRVFGMASLLVGSVALAAAPLYAAWTRRSVALFGLAAVIAGFAFLGTYLAAT